MSDDEVRYSERPDFRSGRDEGGLQRLAASKRKETSS